jgi:FkbM family methyltransferase
MMTSSLSIVGKKFIRHQLEALGWSIMRRAANNGPAIPLLPLLIEHCVLVDGPGAILQIGANDGLFDDPIHEIILKFNLPAILVEPLPDLFRQLRRNYKDQSNIHFENVAISTEPGEAEIFRISRATKTLPQWTQGIASFDKSVLLKHKDWPGVDRKALERSVESVLVPVITVQQLLAKHPDVQKVLALQIDTEGHDFAVVKSAVDGGCLPRIINYEHKHLHFHDQVACRELLSSQGYAFWANGSDTVAYKNGIGII